MKINQRIEVQVDVKVVKVYGKIRDACYYALTDQEGNSIAEHDGYVPSFFPGDDRVGDHGGDYLILDIELETGKILNWTPPTAALLEEFIEKANVKG